MLLPLAVAQIFYRVSHAQNYPLEASAWYWGQNDVYGHKGVNGFIEGKQVEGADPLLIYLKTAYYVAGMPPADGKLMKILMTLSQETQTTK